LGEGEGIKREGRGGKPLTAGEKMRNREGARGFSGESYAERDGS